eukprot:6571259-Prorocentrum_lima.AAC.1
MVNPLSRRTCATVSAERGAVLKMWSSAQKPPGKQSRWRARPPVTLSLARKSRTSLLRISA